jgi:hypothetical protein
MSELNGKVVPVDIVLFGKNRLKADPQLLLAHANEHVAWNGDGTAILASGWDIEEVIEDLEHLGIRGDQVVHDYIDCESRLGGSFLFGGEVARRDAVGRYLD